MWLQDTGCGHDLISRADAKASKAKVLDAENPITFSTANGEAPAGLVAAMSVAEFLDEEVNPYVLDDTPAVLSVGLRCMQKGYSFIWPAGEKPYYVLPDGQVVELEVIDDIPYLRPGCAESQPRAQHGTRNFACPAADPGGTGGGEVDDSPHPVLAKLRIVDRGPRPRSRRRARRSTRSSAPNRLTLPCRTIRRDI